MTNNTKRSGACILFINDKEQVLLFLRDDNPAIAYPNMWDILGGHVEPEETPRECIVREMKEEIGKDLIDFKLFSVMEFVDRWEHVFWKQENLDIEKIDLTEGQCLKWFTRDETRNIQLAYGGSEIIEAFFKEAPFKY